MAERTISVRLRAIHTQYVQAMREVGAETSKAAAAANGAFGGLGAELKSAGEVLTRNVTVPLLALGGAATKFGTDFEETFTRMTTLAGVTADEIDGLRREVLGLAGDTGRGPQELAEALYFASSAGLDTRTSLQLVKAAAQGAAIGLGDAATVTQAITAAMGAYGSDVLTAAQALDVLTAGAKISTVEASQLAPQLGRLLPTAESLGVSFDQVVATLGYLSTKSNDASLAGTQLDGVLRKILVPSEQGRAALQAVGLSADSLRRTVATGGLPAALDVLRAKFGGNSDALFQLFDDIQAFQGAQALLADSTNTLGTAFDTTANSAGQAGEAFDRWSKTDAAKMKKAIAEGKAALIELGLAITPLIAAVAPIAAAFLGAFGGLPTWLQGGIVGLIGLLAALGPITTVAGTLVANFKTLASVATKVFDAMAVGAYNAAGALSTTAAVAGGIGLILAGVAYAWVDNARKTREAEERVRRFTDSIREAGNVASGAADELRRMFEAGENDRLLRNLVEAGVSMDEFAAAVATGGSQLDMLRAKIIAADVRRSMTGSIAKEMERLGLTVDELVARLARGERALGAVGAATPSIRLQQFYGELRRVNDAMSTTTSDVGQAAERAGLLNEAFGSAASGASTVADAVATVGPAAATAEEQLRQLLSTINALYAGSFQVLDAQLGFEQALADTNVEVRSGGGAVRDLTAQQRGLERATKDVTKAQEELAAAEAALAEARKGPTEREKKDASLAVRDAQLGLAEAQRRVADAQKAIREERAKGKDGDVRRAQMELQRAQLDLERAQLRVTDAQAEQNEVMTSGEETSKKVTDAVERVSDANDRLVEAHDRVAEAERSLRSEAATGGPIADRQRQIASATKTAIDRARDWITALFEQKAPASEVERLVGNLTGAFDELEAKNGDANGQIKAFRDYLASILKIAREIPDIGRGLSGTITAPGGGTVLVGPDGSIIDLGGDVTASATPRATQAAFPAAPVPAGALFAASSVQGPVAAPVSTQRPLQVAVDGRVLADVVVQASYDAGGLDIRIRN